MGKQQKTWETPQLIILARSTPAETLELGCKIIERTGISGADNLQQSGCARATGPTNCGACQAREGVS
mgnify:CR=1 FL=1